MNLYAFTGVVEDGMSRGTGLGIIIAQDDDEAHSIALGKLREQLPGWEHYTITILEQVNQELIYNYPPTGERFQVHLIPVEEEEPIFYV